MPLFNVFLSSFHVLLLSTCKTVFYFAENSSNDKTRVTHFTLNLRNYVTYHDHFQFPLILKMLYTTLKVERIFPVPTIILPFIFKSIKVYLGPCQTSMMKFFDKYSSYLFCNFAFLLDF